MPTVSATRTLNPLHFEDLEPHRFEDLVRQLAYDFRTWRSLEATGRLGSDDGLDIRGTEVVPVGPLVRDEEDEPDEPLPVEERQWSIQCKRYKSIPPKLMREIVAETVRDGEEPPYGLIVAAACDVSKKAMDAFRDEARGRGVQEFELWAKARLEDLLIQPRHDHVLFGFFGVSLVTRRRSQLTDIRQRLTVKRKLYRALTSGEEAEPLREPFDKPVLIRDSADVAYPDEHLVSDFSALPVPPWHLAVAHALSSRGLLLVAAGYVGWARPDGAWDVAEDGPNLIQQRLDYVLHWDYQREKREKLQRESEIATTHLSERVPEAERMEVEVLRLLRFGNVQEIDPLGDPIHNVSHLYCIYHPVTGPYDDVRMYFRVPAQSYGTAVELDPEKRVQLFHE